MSKKAVVPRNRNGQALVEFAFISIVLTMLVLGILGLGLMLIHSTATAATSINASMLFDLKIEEETSPGVNPTVDEIYQQFRQRSHYNEKDLVLTAAEFFDPENDLGDADRDRVATLNQKMLSLYFYDIDRQIYRYPGTVVQKKDIDGETEDTILIPIFDQATQSITDWKRPVEISYDPVQDSQTANISIWMASQPSTLLVYNVDNQGNTVAGPQEAETPNIASLPNGYRLSLTSFTPDPRFSRASDANRGTYGLGELELGAIGSVIPRRVVRPYRRVIEFQGTFRLIPKPEEETP